MALGLVLVPALGIALLLGGRPARLADLNVRSGWLVFGALGLQVVAFPFAVLPWTTPGRLAVGLWLCSYALLLVAAGRNIRLPGVALATAGVLLNLIAVTANAGRMPVLPEAMVAAGHAYDVRHNSFAEEAPRLPWLVDRWAAPSWVPLANVFSVGDAAIAAGGVWFVLGATGAGLPRRRQRRAAVA
jgi:hypothetical protein